MGFRYVTLPSGRSNYSVLAANKSKRYALLWACIVHFRFQLLAGVIPRLLSIGFDFAQPFLIERALELTKSGRARDHNVEYGIIAAYAIVYTGIAVRGPVQQRMRESVDELSSGLPRGL